MLEIPQRPCLYTRLSYAPDGSLEKCEHQEERGREAGARLTWPDFCCVYVDNSRSAWRRDRKRPDWDRMLLTLDRDSGKLIPGDPKADHHHDGIMTYHGDRLIRQPYDLELLLNIADTRHIPLASVSGVRDLSSPDDRFVLRIEAAQACREVDNLSRRRKEGYTRMVTRHGKSQQGGHRPYGWGAPTGKTRTVVDRETGGQTEVPILDFNLPVPEETEHLAKVARRMLAGLSVNGGLAYMNSVSTTTQGGRWTSKVLWSVLTAPRIAGMMERDGVLYKASWDAVITNEEREALIALRAQKRKEKPNPGPARKYLLTGTITCGRCRCVEWRTKPIRKSDPRRVYDCSKCHMSRNAEHLDAYVTGRVLRLLSSPRLLAELHAAATDGAPDVAAQITALEARKAHTVQQLQDLADHPDVDAGLAMLSLASFDKKIRELRQKLATTARQRLLTRMTGISREAWETEPVDVRHDVIAALYSIEVLDAGRSGPGFNPASVKLHRMSLGATPEGGSQPEAQLQLEERAHVDA
ncbi:MULTISPECIES: recombinase family protein [unclassified Streptomyces]|uniref:recombinase family protein n=1 Tax=unclassified Streptomyces TaxID=2593676 RepID=UPI000FFF232B|nr:MULTISPECIES: recombinase family protein [unclassified Streptomyces]